MSEAPRLHLAVGEDKAHFALARALAGALDRRAKEGCWQTHKAKDLKPGRKRIHGHLEGRPLGPAARGFRKTLVALTEQGPEPDLVVILQDTDGDLRLREGADQVMAWWRGRPGAFPLAIGLPHSEAEAWLLAGASVPPERLRRAKLPHDPTQRPETLGPQTAKKAVRFLLLGEGASLLAASDRACNEEVEALAEDLAARVAALRGFERCGLAPFLRALDEALSH